ncbi:ADP-ribosylation/crystallin J1 [Chloroflexia bacterium SDU3-3]|nr:ADP-ribosylation/crystallin J1 [Chloroflexia bacterium SDU3-3]
MQLFRPVGLRELALIAASGYRAFPPRLPEQPIFYPVLNADYAGQIARDWNTKDRASGFAGFVMRFELAEPYAQRFPVQLVGGLAHQELWVPAEELAEFNAHIVGPIAVAAAFYGAAFAGQIDATTNMPIDL